MEVGREYFMTFEKLKRMREEQVLIYKEAPEEMDKLFDPLLSFYAVKHMESEIKRLRSEELWERLENTPDPDNETITNQ